MKRISACSVLMEYGVKCFPFPFVALVDNERRHNPRLRALKQELVYKQQIRFRYGSRHDDHKLIHISDRRARQQILPRQNLSDAAILPRLMHKRDSVPRHGGYAFPAEAAACLANMLRAIRIQHGIEASNAL